MKILAKQAKQGFELAERQSYLRKVSLEAVQRGLLASDPHPYSVDLRQVPTSLLFVSVSLPHGFLLGSHHLSRNSRLFSAFYSQSLELSS